MQSHIERGPVRSLPGKGESTEEAELQRIFERLRQVYNFPLESGYQPRTSTLMNDAHRNHLITDKELALFLRVEAAAGTQEREAPHLERLARSLFQFILHH